MFASYGPHFDEERRMPKCMIGGNMCDECFVSRCEVDRRRFIEDTKPHVEQGAKNPACEIPVLPQLRDVASIYELTLTTVKDDPYELREFINKVSKSAIYEVAGYKYSFELTKAGLPHIHCIIWSRNKYCDSSKIKATLKFPYRYEFKRVRNLINFHNYILKEKDDPLIIDYCAKKGIDQFVTWVSE